MSGLSRRCEIIARARRTADSSSCSCAIVVGVSLPAGWPPRFGPSFARDSVLLSLLRTCVFDSGHGFSPASQRNWQQRLEPWRRTIASARVFWFCASPPFLLEKTGERHKTRKHERWLWFGARVRAVAASCVARQERSRGRSRTHRCEEGRAAHYLAQRKDRSAGASLPEEKRQRR